MERLLNMACDPSQYSPLTLAFIGDGVFDLMVREALVCRANSPVGILNAEKVSKTYGEKVLFDQIVLGVNKGDKIGVIGVNGTGKSTFLKIIAGLEEPDEGRIVAGKGVTVSYLSQAPHFSPADTIVGYVLKGKSSASEAEAKAILTKLGINDFDASVSTLSGGQRKRIALAGTLVEPAEVLILDEPTNHLDSEMVIWLEDYIRKFKGELIMVTHDRYFLDNVTNRIVELDKGKLYGYDTNYSGFLELKAQREEAERATEAKRANILRRELEWIRRGCKARSTKQQARIDRYEDMKEASRQARAGFESRALEMNSVSTRLGKKTIELKGISKSFGGRTVINDFSYIFLRDDRIGIIGRNGCGKSTLGRVIVQLLDATDGQILFEGLKDFPATLKLGVAGEQDGEIEALEQDMALGEIKLLANQAVSLIRDEAKLWFVGIEDWSQGDQQYRALAEQIEAQDCVICLSHNPDALPALNNQKGDPWLDAMFSGHTLGGQLTLFGGRALFNPSMYGDRFLSGWHLENRTKLLVSNGLGTGLVPIRFFAPPQVHLVTLRRG